MHIQAFLNISHAALNKVLDIAQNLGSAIVLMLGLLIQSRRLIFQQSRINIFSPLHNMACGRVRALCLNITDPNVTFPVFR